MTTIVDGFFPIKSEESEPAQNDEDGEEGPKNTYNEYFFRAIIIQICASITYYIGFIAIKWGESHLASWGVVVLSIMILLVFEEK